MMQEQNWEQLAGELERLGFTNPYMKRYLRACNGMDEIPYNQRMRYNDDEMSWQVHVRKDTDGLYHPADYTAILLKTHPVPHGRFAGIDTRELEERMKGTDWQRFAYGTAVLDRKASEIIDDIFTLLRTGGAAKDIASRLELRYWLHTPVEQHINIFSDIARYQSRHDFPLKGDAADISARESYNLLCGRGVQKLYTREDDPEVIYSHWQQLVDGQLRNFAELDLRKMLLHLPVVEGRDNAFTPKLLRDLRHGERVAVHKAGTLETCYLHVNPKDRALVITDEQERVTHQAKLKEQTAKKPRKNRGRSL